jgi:DNA mismatch repair protein MutH
VYRKLSHVLWVPVFSDEPEIGKRQTGNPLLWHADQQTLNGLRTDWEEFIDLINMGRLPEISSQHGELLQIRPKGANAKVIRASTDAEGNAIQTLPRGFYLRPEFTRRLLAEAYF